MCGIYGVVSKNKNAKSIVLNGLKKLEYRGYDSAGIAVIDQNNKINLLKEVGKVSVLESKVNDFEIDGFVGFGHNRWATHGKVNLQNCHPHLSQDKNFCIVHNGIIENYLELKIFLQKNGYNFYGETDSEIIPNLVSYFYDKTKNVNTSIKKSIALLKGSFALILYSVFCPNTLFCIRNQSPIVVAKTKGGIVISSDIQAIENASEIYVLKSGEIAKISENIEFFDFDFSKINKTKFCGKISNTKSNYSGFKHFMEKEIEECFLAAKNTYLNYQKNPPKKIYNLLKKSNQIFFVGCGTASHACDYAKWLLNYAGKNATSVIASEFDNIKNLLDKNSLCFFVSQSGETADTILALKTAKEHGAKTVAITNVAGCSLDMEADFSLKTMAGIENGVAATKTYIAQLMCILCLIVNTFDCFVCKFDKILQILQKQISQKFDEKILEKFINYNKIYFIGRGVDFLTCKEASLKVKEITYTFCQALPAGELKHGTLATIGSDVAVFAICSSKSQVEKMVGSINEIKARGAYVVVATNQKFENFESADAFIKLEKVDGEFMPFISIIPFFKFAYNLSVKKGLDPDKPRNLAKSVTVL